MAIEKPTPPARQVLAVKVYDTLKERIMDDEFAADNRINIDALALELKVSQTPIREALSRLAAEGLIDFASYKGYTVRPLLSARELADFLHVRKLLETDAARLAAPRLSLFDLNLLAQLLEEMRAIHPSPKFREYRVFNGLDQRFHEAIVAMSANPFLLQTYQSLNVHLHLARYHGSRETNFRSTMLEHQAIYEALRQHDGEAAAQALAAHIDNAYLRSINRE
jgi:DNA-binding GntR family transcriptional regulator